MRKSSLLWFVVLLPAAQALNHQTWNVTSPTMTAVLRGGNVVGLVNHLTGESLGMEDPRRLDLSCVRLLTGAVSADDMALVDLVSGGGQGRAVLTGSGAEYSIRVWTDSEGDLFLSQKGSAEGRGVTGIQWGLGGIKASEATLIVPGASGVEVDSAYALDSHRFSWPTTWEAQMMILKTSQGGFLIWSEDTELRFKSLEYRRRGDRWEISFGTDNPAPFDDLENATSVIWRITPFSGDWREGARIYREWMERSHNLLPLGKDVPWVRQIRFVAIMGVDPDLLQPLASAVNASSTLLYIPNWRVHDYDRFYPDYTAAPGFSDFVSKAHELGFRVMVHVNYFGVSPDHPLYEDLKEHQMRDPYTKELLWWEWTRTEPPIYIAYINPASSKWRAYLTGVLEVVREEYGVDAFHLDCSHAVFNDANGLVDGLTSPEGNLRLHEELRNALPGVALSGEGLNELTIRYEDFSQRHVLLGINHFDGTWNDNLIEHLHPISSYLFTPFNTMYGYLGICEPDSNPGLWRAWDSAYESLGVVPTLWLRRRSQLEDPGPETMGLLEKAKYFTACLPRPVFPAPDSSVKFAYVTSNGWNASYKRTEFGVVLQEGPREGGRIIVGRVQGTNAAATTGSILGWLAYNSTHIFGLDPTEKYVLLPASRDQKEPHVASLPLNVLVRSASSRPSLFAVGLDRSPKVLYDFVMNSAEAERNVVLTNGSKVPLGHRATFQAGSVSCGGEQKSAIYAIPPMTLPGEVVGTYSVEIPEAGGQLRLLIGLTDMVRQGQSDGATFGISIDGNLIYSYHHSSRSWKNVELDLRPFAGERINLSFSVGPGPSNDPSFDLAAWGEAELIPYVPDPLLCKIFCPFNYTYVITEGVDSVEALGPGLWGILGHLPLGFAALIEKPTEVEAPFDLSQTHFDVKIVRNGIEEEVSGYAQCVPASVSCGGVVKSGLFQHPPPSGRTEASFLLRLPEYPVAFESSVGIRDGSLSEGVLFVFGVNWEELGIIELLPSAWRSVSFDLSPYAGKTILLRLQTDPSGRDYYDWAAWGEPRIVAIPDGHPAFLIVLFAALCFAFPSRRVPLLHNGITPTLVAKTFVWDWHESVLLHNLSGQRA